MDKEEAVGIGGLEGGKIKDCVLVKGTGMQLLLVLGDLGEKRLGNGKWVSLNITSLEMYIFPCLLKHL